MVDRRWKGSTFGSGWMHRNLIRLLRFTDVRILYLFSDIFIVPVCLLLNTSRKTACEFYRSRLGFGVLKSVHYTCRNHCLFAQVVIDRFAMYAGKRFKVEIEGGEYFEALASREEGFLHLSSHIGNYEIAGYTLGSKSKSINAVVYPNEKESVMNNRNSMFVKTNVKMIALKEDMSHLFEIDEAICRGDIVSFPSDRYMSGAKCIKSRFLGSDAKFPQGPFSVATMRGIEVLAVNVMKTGTLKYRIHITPLPYDRSLPRREQIQTLCNSYVCELERMVKLYPTQWYNFYNFWEDATD